ncbi:MAG: family 43 glycosylhydrolase [Candidatus Azobacteroides sp.]|nr:family 43 glycosylhydrolase [Candidatus Azobacteroides sp.]
MKRIFFFLVNAILLSSYIQGQSSGYFTNPVIPGDLADPSVIRIGEMYYATATSSEWAPYFPVFGSTDLVNWEQKVHIFTKKPEWTSNSFWAPELYCHNGKVYCYYTARREADGVSYIGVATANSPLEEFTDHGLLVEYGTEAIDAFVYNDEGQLYITWKAYGLDRRPIEIIGSKLSADGLRLEGEPFSLLKDEENIGMEGQYHFKKGDYYYIIYAAHGCCGPFSDYDVYVARSENFKGPYEKYQGNPVLHGGNEEYLSCGHGTIVDAPDGRMFYMCHAYLKGDGVFAGRQPILQEMRMTEDKWVRFLTGEHAVRKQPVPFPGTIQKKRSGFEDNFDTPDLKVNWSWNYPYAEPDIKIKNDQLYVNGFPKEGNKYGTALCVRAEVPVYSYCTRVANDNNSLKGLTMYGDNNNLLIWGIAGNQVVLKYVKDGQESILYKSDSETVHPWLKIEVEKGCLLAFYQSENGKDWEKAREEVLDVSHLMRWDRVARPGLIHAGKQSEPAAFSFFRLMNK